MSDGPRKDYSESHDHRKQRGMRAAKQREIEKEEAEEADNLPDPVDLALMHSDDEADQAEMEFDQRMKAWAEGRRKYPDLDDDFARSATELYAAHEASNRATERSNHIEPPNLKISRFKRDRLKEKGIDPDAFEEKCNEDFEFRVTAWRQNLLSEIQPERWEPHPDERMTRVQWEKLNAEEKAAIMNDRSVRRRQFGIARATYLEELAEIETDRNAKINLKQLAAAYRTANRSKKWGAKEMKAVTLRAANNGTFAKGEERTSELAARGGVRQKPATVSDLMRQRAEEAADKILAPYFKGLDLEADPNWKERTKLNFYLDQSMLADKVLDRVDGKPIQRNRMVDKEDEDVKPVEENVTPETAITIIQAIFESDGAAGDDVIDAVAEEVDEFEE